MDKQKSKMNSVFWIAVIIVASFVLIGGIFPERFAAAADAALKFTTTKFGWFYLAAVFVICVFLIYLTFSKYGKIKLGADDEKPAYPLFTWIGMLFSAGFGIALVFYGIGEPMSHFFTPPYGDIEPQTAEAGRMAMGYAFFHYGISQWSVFALLGLAMAYFQFRKKQNGLVSSTLSPLIGKGRHEKPAKNFIDIFAVVATVMGVATSVGLGILQIDGGIRMTFGLGESFWLKLGIVVLLTVLYLLSATTGLDKGIRWLSNFNLAAALVFMLFVFTAGPTVFILNTFVVAVGDYLNNFISYSLRLTPYTGGTWVYDWTVFYWAWAIAWAPFVGAFVARVSRGRTIREFILGVMVAPPAIALAWIAVFGGTAIHLDLFEGTRIADAVNADITSALFTTLGHLPLTDIVSVLVLFLILTFLVTSADSAIFILSSMTTGGSLNPPFITKIVWGVLLSAIALILLLASGLNGLQTASLVSALPFTVILLLIGVSFFRLLSAENSRLRSGKEVNKDAGREGRQV